eukprot:m.23487 g.23487  ORF g.23487 m.23487 type:complete len:388 (+) comp8986_c0_seq1:88-1251(+)
MVVFALLCTLILVGGEAFGRVSRHQQPQQQQQRHHQQQHSVEYFYNRRNAPNDTKCEQCPQSSFANHKDPSNPCLRFGTCKAGECPIPPPDYSGPGYQPPGGNKTLCTRCANGFFQNMSGATACKYCPSGYQPTELRNGCVRCNPGEVSSHEATGGLCVSCFEERYGFVADANNTKCLPCGDGQMSYDSISCEDCKRGFYWDPTKQICPFLCQSGHMCTESKIPGSSGTYCSACTACREGSFQSKPGQYQCILCPAGTFQPSEGQTTCTPCQSGFVQTESGGISCTKCPAGSYCPNGTSVQPCPEGQYCPSGSTHPKTCPSLFDPTSSSCTMSTQLVAIVSSCAVVLLAVVAILVYRRHRLRRKKDLERQALLEVQRRNKQPRYTGL